MILLVKCCEKTCQSPYFYTPSKENYTVIGLSVEVGDFAAEVASIKEIRDDVDEEAISLIDGLSTVVEVDYDDYLVVYCNKGHKNYISFKNKENG